MASRSGSLWRCRGPTASLVCSGAAPRSSSVSIRSTRLPWQLSSPSPRVPGCNVRLCHVVLPRGHGGWSAAFGNYPALGWSPKLIEVQVLREASCKRINTRRPTSRGLFSGFMTAPWGSKSNAGCTPTGGRCLAGPAGLPTSPEGTNSSRPPLNAQVRPSGVS